MIHIKDGGRLKVDPKRFNEAFLMHESTSPFYPMFASIDVSAKMMAGQPVMMPGERFTEQVRKTMDYLAMLEHFDNQFPGFESEIHGISGETVGGRKVYRVDCVKERADQQRQF